MRTEWSGRLGWLGAIMLSAVMVACGSAAVPMASISAVPERDHVRFVYGSTAGVHAPLPIAVAQNLFQKYGLTATAEFAESNTGIAALISGDAQLDLGDGVTTVQAIASGSPLKIVAYIDKENPYAIVGRPDISSPSDLKGKTVAIGKVGDTSDISLRVGLTPYGVTVGQDVNVLQVGNSPSRWAALVSGQVAASILDESTFKQQALSQGMHILVSLRDQRIPYANASLVVTESFAKENPKTVTAALKGLVDGTRFFADENNRAASMAVVAKDLKLGPDDPQVAAAYESFHTHLSTDAFPDKAGVETILQALTAIDPARYGSISSDKVIDASFATALRSGSS